MMMMLMMMISIEAFREPSFEEARKHILQRKRLKAKAEDERSIMSLVPGASSSSHEAPAASSSSHQPMPSPKKVCDETAQALGHSLVSVLQGTSPDSKVARHVLHAAVSWVN